MFFFDLEPDHSNKDIFNVKSILHTLVKVEELHKRRDIPQCLNCQSYGHTRTYCFYPPRCVNCGEDHPTSVSKKTPDTRATCALCSSSHPANYKGCSVHKELQNRRRHPFTSAKLNQKPHLKQPHCPAPLTSSLSSNLQSNTRLRSYAKVTSNYLNSPLSMYPPPRAFYPSEVEFNLKKNSPKKSPGFDLISVEVVKYLPRKP